MDTIFVSLDYNDDTLGAYNYNWNFGNGTTSSIWHPYIYYSAPGEYTVRVIISDSNSVLDTLYQTFIVPDTCEKKKPLLNIIKNEEAKITIYPNPSDNRLNIVINDATSSNNYNIQIYSILGKCIYSQNSESSKISISLTNFSTGVYTRAVHINNIKYVYKIIIIH